MLRLHALGGAALVRDGVPITGPATQQRRLALLAAIAGSGDRGISRDVLMGVLWPDASPDRARHALSQWLFLMRRDLGADLLLGSNTLHLNPEQLTADVAEFDAAVARHDDIAAAALYTGPFLEGFFLSDAPEFEQWLDRERDRRHREALRVIERLARAAEASEPTQSVIWWQRMSVLDPINSPAATNLVRVLIQLGDPVAALGQARRHEAALRRELDIAPSHEFVELVESASRLLAANGSTRSSEGSHSDAYLAAVRDRLASRYVVDQLVVRTSMTSVFEARAGADLAPFVLKVFLPDLMARSDRDVLVQRLRDVSTLRHPCIHSPIDVDLFDGIVYSAFPGRVTPTLRKRIEQEGRLPLHDAISIARTVASTLVHAHDQGIAHGDLTPRRIETPGEIVRVADFGVKTAVSAAIAESLHDSVISLGTPAYMSPEELTGESIAAEAGDVYSLGCIMYHMIGGAPPHVGASTRATITNRLREPAAPLRSLRADLSSTLEQLIARMLDRSPAARPAAEQVVEALRS